MERRDLLHHTHAQYVVRLRPTLAIALIVLSYLTTVLVITSLSTPWLWLAPFVLTLVGLVWLRAITNKLSRIDSMADERERQLHDQALRISYFIIALLPIAALSGLLGFGTAKWQEGERFLSFSLDFESTLLVIWGFCVLCVVLPPAIISLRHFDYKDL